MNKRLAWQCDKLTHLTAAQADELTRRAAKMKPAPSLRCVRLDAEDRPDLLRYIREALLFDRHGVLPVSGGLYDQDARWVAAVDILGGILNGDDNSKPRR